MAKSEMFLFWWKLQLISNLEHSSVIFIIIPWLLIVNITYPPAALFAPSKLPGLVLCPSGSIDEGSVVRS